MPCYCCRYVWHSIWFHSNDGKKKESLISNATTCEVVLSVVCFFIVQRVSFASAISQWINIECECVSVRTVVSHSSIFLNFTKIMSNTYRAINCSVSSFYNGFKYKGNPGAKILGCQLHATIKCTNQSESKCHEKKRLYRKQTHVCVSVSLYSIFIDISSMYSIFCVWLVARTAHRQQFQVVLTEEKYKKKKQVTKSKQSQI